MIRYVNDIMDIIILKSLGTSVIMKLSFRGMLINYSLEKSSLIRSVCRFPLVSL